MYEVAWWTHLGIVLYFLTWIPEGKHLHLVTLIPNVFLRKARPRGALRSFGVRKDVTVREHDTLGLAG